VVCGAGGISVIEVRFSGAGMAAATSELSGARVPFGRRARAVAAAGQVAGSNRAVKWRSRLGWETICMPGRSQAR
jgi:hypothetical protein